MWGAHAAPTFTAMPAPSRVPPGWAAAALRAVWPITLAALAAACVSGRNARLHPGVRDQYSLQADELMSLGPVASLYDVVARLRHRWLEPRAFDPAVPAATDQVVVYSGNRQLGGVDELRYISVQSVQSVRFVRPPDSEALYGPGHAGGVIVVEMKT